MGRDASTTATSGTLLDRLRRHPTDQAAWQEFVHRYGPRVYQWCRRYDLQEADAQDATQNVLLKLAAKLRTFEYDPTRSFRGWLRTVTQSVLSDFLAERRRANLVPLGNLDGTAARNSLLQELEEEFDRELLREAMAQVQLRVAPHRWEAFRLTAVEGLSGSEAAARLQMKVATIFTTKSKIQRLLQEELQRLENPGSPQR
jgi:RNA polymerase sigma-70 factor (ECF subfamily)